LAAFFGMLLSATFGGTALRRLSVGDRIFPVSPSSAYSSESGVAYQTVGGIIREARTGVKGASALRAKMKEKLITQYKN